MPSQWPIGSGQKVRKRTMGKKSTRDEFTEQVKRTIGERAGYICTKCRRQTVGPHSNYEKSLKTGEACHIRAAAAGGPRYDRNQTQDERSSIENAIWLCRDCSALIDKNEAEYAVEFLLEMKGKHEAWLKNGGIVPALPRISLTTINGRTIPDVSATITGQDVEETREHSLMIENAAEVPILTISARVQLPEPIRHSLVRHRPAGVEVLWEPVRPRMVAIIKGGGTVTRNRPPQPTNVYQLQIDRLPPSHHVEIEFVTSTDPWPPAKRDDPLYLPHYVDGAFQFEYQGVMVTKPFFAPIIEDKENRHFSILEVREDFGKWKPVELTSFS